METTNNKWLEQITDYIRESNLIEDIDSLSENKNSLRTWEWLSGQEEIDGLIVCELQGRITKDNSWLAPKHKGAWRDCGVRVGAHIAPDPRKVPGLMDVWCQDFYGTGVIEAHIEFETIHPFVDGNGRTGRMLYWWHCLKTDVEPILFTADDRQNYYNLFRERDLANTWIEHLNGGV